MSKIKTNYYLAVYNCENNSERFYFEIEFTKDSELPAKVQNILNAHNNYLQSKYSTFNMTFLTKLN